MRACVRVRACVRARMCVRACVRLLFVVVCCVCFLSVVGMPYPYENAMRYFYPEDTVYFSQLRDKHKGLLLRNSSVLIVVLWRKTLLLFNCSRHFHNRALIN